MTSPTRPRSLATAALLTGLLLSLPGAKNGCFSQEANETLLSPVQAVTTVLEHADGTVEAELVLISTAASPHAYVDSAKNATLRVPGGEMVALELSSSGHYGASSLDTPELQYLAGETYQFTFELDDEAAAKDVAGGDFVAVVDAPDDQVSFELAEAPAFAGDTALITWAPSKRYALIRVYRQETGELSYSNFDFASSPHFDGSKWARLTKGGSRELGVDTFPEAGEYVIEVCAVDAVRDFDTSLSAELGALSGFLVGRCAPVQKIAVPE